MWMNQTDWVEWSSDNSSEILHIGYTRKKKLTEQKHKAS